MARNEALRLVRYVIIPGMAVVAFTGCNQNKDATPSLSLAVTTPAPTSPENSTALAPTTVQAQPNALGQGVHVPTVNPKLNGCGGGDIQPLPAYPENSDSPSIEPLPYLPVEPGTLPKVEPLPCLTPLVTPTVPR